MRYHRLKEHIVHKSGLRKTVCVTACLTYFGVPVNGFHYSGLVDDGRREAILRRHGYSVRSRKSRMGKQNSIGALRKMIPKWKDPAGTKYLVVVQGRTYCHAMVLNQSGTTVIDTAPRKRDKRKVVSIHAVFVQE